MSRFAILDDTNSTKQGSWKSTNLCSTNSRYPLAALCFKPCFMVKWLILEKRFLSPTVILGVLLSSFGIYTRTKCTWPLGNVFELLYLSKKYIVPHLAESCCRFLTAELRESNVFRILEHARLFSESDLEQRCWRLLETKTSACLQTEGLLWISRDTLSSLLKRDALTLVDGECAVFKAAKRWATASCKVQYSELQVKSWEKFLKTRFT